MRRKGFTLSEVLITLSIIGIVAATSMPIISSSVKHKRVGPQLRKFSAVMENANSILLAQQGATKLSKAVSSFENDYIYQLPNIVKGSVAIDSSGNAVTLTNYAKPALKTFTGSSYGSEGAFPYVIRFQSNDEVAISNGILGLKSTVSQRGTYLLGTWKVCLYDINGFKTGPNKLAKDIFMFIIDNSGVMVPVGSKQEMPLLSGETPEAPRWQTSCGENATPSGTVAGLTCAGSIADNDWKVVYAY